MPRFARTEIASCASEVARARAFVAEMLESWGQEDRNDVVDLLTSELVTNAVRHASQTVEVGLALDDGVLRVEATDDDPSEPTVPPLDRAGESGRGMYLIDRLADGWGVEHRPPTSKAVWFETEVSPLIQCPA
jgi:anti-sigma regulatory factor (Ser/Thr protein kinase)